MTRIATNIESVGAASLTPGHHSARARVVVSNIVRIGLGCLLLVSAVTKLQNPYAFLATLDQYELIGPKMAVGVAMMLPFLELAVGACLIGGCALRATWVWAVLLFATFLFATTSVAYRGLRTTCGCFGTLESSDVTWGTVVRCAGLLGAAVIGLCLSFSRPRH